MAMVSEQNDLFGAPLALPNPAKGKRVTPKPKGYAFTPGTGPAGRTCGDCEHHVVRRMAKRYHKCKLVRAKWTGGPGTDIRVRSPACKFFQQERVDASANATSR